MVSRTEIMTMLQESSPRTLGEFVSIDKNRDKVTGCLRGCKKDGLIDVYQEGDSKNSDERLHYALTQKGRGWSDKKVVAPVKKEEKIENKNNEYEETIFNLRLKIKSLESEVKHLKEMSMQPSVSAQWCDIGYAAISVNAPRHNVFNNFDEAKEYASKIALESKDNFLIIRCFKVATVSKQIAVTMEE